MDRYGRIGKKKKEGGEGEEEGGRELTCALIVLIGNTIRMEAYAWLLSIISCIELIRPRETIYIIICYFEMARIYN